MKRMDSLKRFVILQLSFIGLLFHTAVYAFFWFHEYYPYLRFHGKANFFFKGHILIILIYFVLLFFFASTYGALKIGYLKPTDVFLSEFFSLLFANVISYFQISLMANWIVSVKPIAMATLIQTIASAVWIFVCNTCYYKAFPPREILIIHGERSINDIVTKFESRREKYKIRKSMNISEGVEAVKKEIANGYGRSCCGIFRWQTGIIC